jgi:lactoylglutathione lyase
MISGFQQFGHIAIRVKDMDASLDFYCNKLGFPEFLRLHRDNGDLWLVYVRITDDQYLEIFPYAIGERAAPREQVGVNHICITVDNIDNIARQLAEAGIPLIQPVGEGADGNRGAYIEDPDGNRFELMQMRPDCIQYKALERWHKGRAVSA